MRRSRWGWGYEERAVSLDALAVRARPLLTGQDPETAVPDDAIALPPPRVSVPAELAAFASAAALERATHTYGKSYPDKIRGFRGEYSVAPDLVARPRDETEIERTLEVAAREKLAVIPFGGGSSVVSGVTPRLGAGHLGAISLDLGAMSRVLELDDVSRIARIQAGAFGPDLEAQLGANGMTLRHFPQSFEFSTLGGWIATRAGGHFATVYTHIDDLVAGVRMLTPRGPFETRTLPASGAGPDPNRLVCGSEGTLGIITDAHVRVRPRPRFRASASVRFARFDDAVAATREVAQSGLFPANCRLLDPMEAFLNGVATDGSSVLVLGFESADHPVRGAIETALSVTAAHGGTCKRGATVRDGDEPRAEDEGAAWRAAFLEGPYLQDGMIRLGVIADTFETACTWKDFRALYETVVWETTRTMTEVAGLGFVSCRFTHVYPDGPAPYFTFLARGRRGGELEAWEAIKKAASDALARAGGTITHHHAVGHMHRPWYDRERPDLFAEAMRATKRVFDPDRVLNPGVLFDS